MIPEALFIVPVAANLAMEEVSAALGGAKLERLPPQVGIAAESYRFGGMRFVRGMSLEIMAASDAAIVASGTATLECALLGTPLVVVYTMSELSYQIAKRAVKLPYVSLVNLMAGRRLVSEFIQEFSTETIAAEVAELVRPGPRRKEMVQSFEDIRDNLKGAAADSAACAIIEHMSGNTTGRPLPL